MRLKYRLVAISSVWIFSLLSLTFVSVSFAAPQYQILHAFTAGSDGGGLYSGVVFDRKGNLYGTTTGGGAYGEGTVFKLKPQPSGQWVEKVLHSFRIDDNGYDSTGTLVIDAAASLYGTTELGGAHNAGTAFEMTPGPSGWIFNVLYSFCAQPSCSDSGSLLGGLALDPAGNLYGAHNTVFELTPGPDDWALDVLYTFCSKPGCVDGGGAAASLILDAKGNLYGTTESGGAHQNGGTAFKLRHMPDGSWKERVLHSFRSFPKDGIEPGLGQLALDNSGSLYGTTLQGGSQGCGEVACGTVFRVTPQPDGKWKETILHNFKPGNGGNGPGGGVVIDGTGNLYGTTFYGGGQCDCGVVYKLAPNPDGTWVYSVLHRFIGSDGAFPDANLILDDKGNLYGTTIGGGLGFGVVFEITP